MATFQQRGVKWRAIVRKKGHTPRTKTCDSLAAAKRWAAATELAIEKHGADTGTDNPMVADLVEKIIDDADERNPMGRTKLSMYNTIGRTFGHRRCSQLTADLLVEHVKLRADSVEPSTLAMDMVYLRQFMVLAKEFYGARVDLSAVDKAVTYARRHSLVGRSAERVRRPTDAELKLMIEAFDSAKRMKTPMSDITRFAIASCMRQGEITSLRWEDLDTVKKVIRIRNRKHPTLKKTNHQIVPLLYGSFDIIKRQPKTSAFIFPYNPESVSTNWTRYTASLGIEDLHFHDLRREGISRMFEDGYSVMEVIKVSGHRDVNMIKRYVELQAEDLHEGPGFRRVRPEF